MAVKDFQAINWRIMLSGEVCDKILPFLQTILHLIYQFHCVGFRCFDWDKPLQIHLFREAIIFQLVVSKLDWNRWDQPIPFREGFTGRLNCSPLETLTNNLCLSGVALLRAMSPEPQYAFTINGISPTLAAWDVTVVAILWLCLLLLVILYCHFPA